MRYRDHLSQGAEHLLCCADRGREVAEEVCQGGENEIAEGVLRDVPSLEPMGEQLGPEGGIRCQGQKTPADVSRWRDPQLRQTARRAPVIGHRDESRDRGGVGLDGLQGGGLAVSPSDRGDGRAGGVEQKGLERGFGLRIHLSMSRCRTAASTP